MQEVRRWCGSPEQAADRRTQRSEPLKLAAVALPAPVLTGPRSRLPLQRRLVFVTHAGESGRR